MTISYPALSKYQLCRKDTRQQTYVAGLKVGASVFVFAVKLGPVVQSIVSLMSSLRVISLTVLADSIYNILIFFAEKTTTFFQHICVSLDVNFNESLSNNAISIEQLGPEC